MQFVFEKPNQEIGRYQKYQTGKYQTGKYLASFAWTSVAQLAEVSKPGIASERKRWPGRLFPSSESAFELLGGLSSLERSSETSLASLETGRSHRAKLTRGGSGTKAGTWAAGKEAGS